MGSYEHVRGSSPARSEYRKMSLNPVATQLPPAPEEEPVGAFEVSKPKRIGEQFQLAFSYKHFAEQIGI